MSCISSNFSSFFLDSLNDPSEFAKYLGNGENKMQTFDEFQMFGSSSCSSNSASNFSNGHYNGDTEMYGDNQNQTTGTNQIYSTPTQQQTHFNNSSLPQTPTSSYTSSSRWTQPALNMSTPNAQNSAAATVAASSSSSASHHFDGSFEFLKYLRHTTEYEDGSSATSNGTVTPTPNANTSLIDLDSTPITSRSHLSASAHLSRSNLSDMDTFDPDSKHNIFDLQHQTSNNSNDNSSTDPTVLAPHLSASNSNASSDVSDTSNNQNAATAPKPLMKFVVKDNFDVHPSHKVEEGIFQHMNKLPVKKKETLKQLGVTFTGHMSIHDKSIIVDNFSKFCQEYTITDHRPFLSLNQSGMQKAEQIKFARYLGQGLPKFTLFCIYSNFKNLFCTKRFENYSKDNNYDLRYILDKTKHFLSCTTADLKSLTKDPTQPSDGVDSNSTPSKDNSNANPIVKNTPPKVLDRLKLFENYDVHETHRIEDGIFTHMSRLSPKKQELLKQFGIQNNHNVTYYEKYIIIENFIKFCNEYEITDHRPFLDFQESGMDKEEQIKFVRYLGQGLPNLTLHKIYFSFKDVLGLNRIEKITVDGYNLDVILKKKKKNLYNRMHAAVHRESTEAAKQAHRENLAS